MRLVGRHPPAGSPRTRTVEGALVGKQRADRGGRVDCAVAEPRVGQCRARMVRGHLQPLHQLRHTDVGPVTKDQGGDPGDQGRGVTRPTSYFDLKK